jgi:integrase/DNA-binding XRE family transcriptional regulator
MKTVTTNGANLTALADLERILAAHPNLLALLRDPARQRKEITAAEVIARYNEFWKLGRQVCKVWEREKLKALNDFSAMFGHLTVSELTGTHLLKWVASHEGWKSGWLRRKMVVTIKGAFRFAHLHGLAERNPFTLVTCEQGDRGQVMTPEQFQAMLRSSGPEFRRVLLFLRLTGCRPCEMWRAEWQHLDESRWCIVFHKHKTSHSRADKKPRTIVLSPVLIKLIGWIRRHPTRSATADRHGKCIRCDKHSGRVALVRGLCPRCHRRALRQIRSGKTTWSALEVQGLAARTRSRMDEDKAHIFLNAFGQPWKLGAVCKRIRKIKKRLNLPVKCTAYGLRRAFGTDCILRGVDLKTTSVLLGHTNTEIAAKHYCLIDGNVDHLRNAASKAMGQKVPAPEANGNGRRNGVAKKPAVVPVEKAPPSEDDLSWESLGKRIRKRRKSQHRTLADVAEQVGIHFTYLSNVELGRHIPSIDVLDRIAKALRVEAKDLLREPVHPASLLNSAQERPPYRVGVGA